LRIHPGTFLLAPIVGASRLDHIEDALAADEVALSAEEIARLERPYRPHPITEGS
jgi:1-deoxyxylulose-5-phosphate synthase